MTTAEETGGTLTIESYNLVMFDSSTSQWVELVGESISYPYTDLSFTKTGLTTGTDYRFKIRAKNVHGFGDYSEEITIRADDKPSKMNAVSTTISGLNAVITWAYPPSDNGSEITAYKIFLLQEDGSTYTEETVHCDGSQ